MDFRGEQTVLEEAYDENYKPTEEEILQYCEVIGLDPVGEKDLLYIAKEGTRAPLPPGWKPVEDRRTGKIYYFNFKTNESTWDHPCDKVYRNMLAEERRKRERASGSKKKSSKKASKANSRTQTASEPQKMAVAASGPLNPLVAGGRLAPLAPLKDLPPLKLKTGGLDPIQPPLAVAPGRVSTDPVGHTITPSLSAPLSFSQKTPLTAPPLHQSTTKVTQPAVKPLMAELKASNTAGVPRAGATLGQKMKPDLFGRTELDTNLKISTQFVEEEEDDSSSDISQRFKSKLLGHHLLDNKDLGLQSQEELNSSEADNITEELERVLQSDDEEDDGAGGERPVAPLGRRPPPTSFSPNEAPLSPLLSPPIPLSLSPLPTATHSQPHTTATHSQPHTTATHGDPHITAAHGQRHTTATHSQLHTAATHGDPHTTAAHSQPHTLFHPSHTASIISHTKQATTTSSHTVPAPSTVSATANGKGLPITAGSSITPPPGMIFGTKAVSIAPGPSNNDRDMPITPSAAKSNETASSMAQEKLPTSSPMLAPVTTSSVVNGTNRFAQSEKKCDQADSASIQNNIRAIKEENEREMEKLRQEHEAALKRVREQLSAELEAEKETAKKERTAELERLREEGVAEVEKVQREGREELERVRRTVEEERAKEERELRDRKLKNMLELKKELKEEEEEEEAKLVEEKEDSIRQTKQKLASEKEKEEAKLKQEAARLRQELIRQLATEREEEENRLKSVASQEISKLRAEAEREGEAKREEVMREIQRQLQVFREEQEDKHNKERAEIEENCREQLEALKREEQLKVQSELERKQSAEEEREKMVQQQQHAIASLQEELAAELEAKRSELQEGHCATLEALQRELGAALESAKAEHQSKVEEERERLKSEFESICTAIRMEHEGRVEQLKKELATSEEQYNTQLQVQSEKLETLKLDYDTKHCELQELLRGLETQSQEMERERKRIAEDQTRIGRREVRMRRETEQKRKQGDNPLLSIVNDPTFSSEPTVVGSFSLPHSRLDSRAGKHRVFRRVKMDKSNHGRTKVVAERAHDVKSEEDWSEVSSSVGSMKLEELVPALTSSTAHTPDMTHNFESIHTMLERNQRMLEKVLAKEQKMATVEEELLKRERGALREGKRHKMEEREGRKRCNNPTPEAKKEHGLLPSNTVKSKLKEEVRALGELEKKLRSSRELLFSREQELRNLHSQLSEDLASDRDCRAQGRYGSRSPSPAAELKEMVSDRDGDKTPTHALQRSSALRTPTEYERGRSKQYSSASSVNCEGRTSKTGRGKSEEVTGHTKVEESPHELGQRDIRTRPEQHSSGPSHSESEAEMSGSSNSHSESPTPSQDVPITKKEQLQSQRDMVRSLNSINRQLRQLATQISHSSPHLGLSPQPVVPAHYPTTPPHTATATRWAEPVTVQGMLPPPQLQSQHTRGSRDSTRSRQLSTSPHRSMRFRRASGGHKTGSPTHQYPGPVEMTGSQTLQYQTDWLQEFHTQFPSSRHLVYSLPFPQPLPAPPGPYSVPHAQLVMDRDRNIHLVHM